MESTKKSSARLYKEVAAKYKSEKAADMMLTRHVRGGSKGVWGSVAMPPQAGISDGNLNLVVTWILTL